MTIRILLTLAILAGLAVAPTAQTFRWEPNSGRSSVNDRVQRAVERAYRDVERQVRVQVRTAIRASGTYGYRWNDRSTRYIDQTGTEADPCAGNRGDNDDDYRQHCEVRESTMPAGPLSVDAGDNGGISVEAWDRNEIRVRAIVRGSARTEERARAIAGGVQVQTGSGRVSATGPDSGRREWWSVSYRINVPRKSDLDLNANNGGITITGVNGTATAGTDA